MISNTKVKDMMENLVMGETRQKIHKIMYHGWIRMNKRIRIVKKRKN